MPTRQTFTRLTSLSLCALLGALTASAQAPSAETPAPAAVESQAPHALTLEECVARAMKRNFDLQIQTFTTENAKESLKVARADYDPAFTASTSRSGVQTYLNSTKTNTGASQVGVSQKIVTGATVTMTTNLDRSSTNASAVALNPAYAADVSLSLSQPLLKNGGTTTNRAAINRAKIGMDKAGLDYRSSVLTVVRDVERAYYALCYAREQYGVLKKSLELAETLLSESKSRKEVGLATELDVLQAEVGVATARRSLNESNQTVHDGEDALTNLIGQFEFGTPVGEVHFPDAVEMLPSFDQSYKRARENQPDLLSTKASIKQSEIDAATSKNARLPSLDLGTAVGYNTKESSVRRAYNELPGSNGYDWQVDLTFRMPWGLKAENARYRGALNTLNQNRARLQQQEQNLIVSVRSAVRSVETNQESVKISALATQLSEKKYELEKAKFDNGQSTARRVLEAQDDLESARVSELQAKVALRNAVAELRRLEGSSMQLYGINLPQ
jgi:outer membrane protein TolC